MLERELGERGAIINCGGRINLFAVWNRRSEFNNKQVAFMADKDLYVFKKIPSQYKGINFTYGYSIENDILSSKKWMRLFDQEDNNCFNDTLNIALKYYWKQCKDHYTKGSSPEWVSTFRLIQDHKTGSICDSSGCETCSLFIKIKNNPYKYLRGKNLLDCAHYTLSRAGRSTKYKADHIMEFSVTPRPIGKFKRIVDLLKNEITRSTR
jgi:hypothetical protein